MVIIQKLLVIEDNVLQCKQIVNYICEKNENIKLHNIAYTYKEAIEVVKNQMADIILLDLKLPDRSGAEIVNYLQENNITKYLQSIIVVSGEKEIFSTITNSPYIYSYVPKPYSLEIIQNHINSIVHSKSDKLILEKINNELTHLHYNFSYNGTRYLAETIFEIYKLKDSFKNNLKKDIYPIIAKKHNKSINTIHGNIKQSTKCMCLDCEEIIINQYFNYNYFVKPKLKEIIFTIINKIS